MKTFFYVERAALNFWKIKFLHSVCSPISLSLRIQVVGGDIRN